MADTFHPGRVLTDAGLSVADHRGFCPCALPDATAARVRGAWRRGEVRYVDSAADGVAVVCGRLRVILTAATHDPTGHTWLHLSASREDRRLPEWPELVHARDVLIGDDVEAYQVAPPRDRYVDRHPGVLHLWACLDGPRLPAFEAVASDGGLTI